MPSRLIICRLPTLHLPPNAASALALAKAGLLADQPFTVHWENLSAFCKEFPEPVPTESLYFRYDRIERWADAPAHLAFVAVLIGRNRIGVLTETDRPAEALSHSEYLLLAHTARPRPALAGGARHFLSRDLPFDADPRMAHLTRSLAGTMDYLSDEPLICLGDSASVSWAVHFARHTPGFVGHPVLSATPQPACARDTAHRPTLHTDVAFLRLEEAGHFVLRQKFVAFSTHLATLPRSGPRTA